MSAVPSFTPNVAVDKEMAPLVSSLLVVFLVLLSLLMAVLVAIVVYVILVKCYFRGTSNLDYTRIRLVRADKDEKKLDTQHKLLAQNKKSAHPLLATSSAQLVLNYIDQLAQDKNRIDEEWKSLQTNSNDELPAMVTSQTSWSAVSIYDDEHQQPKYLTASDPRLGCANELWELVTREHVSSIIALSNDYSNTYWPIRGTQQYGKFRVRLVSEHKHSAFVIRSFMVRMTKGAQFSSTVTQYHLLNWPQVCKPSTLKSFLEFRRKVNQSPGIPILVHCTDGISQTGAYCLIDIVLNRTCRGIREFDVCATLEHLRDQKQGMVPTKDLYELAIAIIVEGTIDLCSVKSCEI